MAQPSKVTGADRKAELISELAWARAELARDVHDARNDLDLVARFKHSVAQRKTAWITGAAAVGWILSRLPGRKKKQPAPKALHMGDSAGHSGRAAFWLALLGALFNLFKPLLTTLASHKINELAARSGGGWRK
ncbi:MAG: hypothetical protein WCO68_02815 [Verrucomicrobiota bacterium]